MSTLSATTKAELHARLRALAAVPAADVRAALGELFHDDVRWHGSCPLDEISGLDALAERVYEPLHRALPALERRDQLFLLGSDARGDWVATLGQYQATFSEPWLDIPASGGLVALRYGEIYQLRDGKIARAYCLWDLLDLMRQAGCWPIAPSVGAEGFWPAPATADGVRLDQLDAAQGAANLAVVHAMHGALFQFDGKNLDSMPHAQYWADDFYWYGPSGIGAARSLEHYQNHHSIPFLGAFPDRGGGDDFVGMGDGAYVVTGGWPGVIATHGGDGWLGLPATGRRVNMRVMDFYRLENGLIEENWVPLDIIDVLRQLGVDVFDRLRHLTGRPRDSL